MSIPCQYIAAAQYSRSASFDSCHLGVPTLECPLILKGHLDRRMKGLNRLPIRIVSARVDTAGLC